MRDITTVKQVIFSGFDKRIEIESGSFSNHNLLAVLSSVQEVSFNPSDFFVAHEIDKVGIILVRFFINGVETYIEIDDSLPITSDGKLASLCC